MRGNLCIIPARGGSKRIPRKNIRNFLGKPIIAYSIEAAIKSGLFETVIVSTDDNEIAKIAIEFGAEVPFMRSKENANDYATTYDVIEEVVKDYKKENKNFENILCCYATAPFVTSERIKEGFQLLKDKGANAIIPIVEFGFPILRSLKMETDHQIQLNWPEYLNSRSQDLPPSFHDAGQWYWMNSHALLKNGKIFSDNTLGLKLSHLEVQDIDNEVDWKLAELKYEFLQSSK